MGTSFGWKKSICTVVTSVFTMTQLLIYAPTVRADKITEYGAAGEQFGNSIRDWAIKNPPTLSGKTITGKTQDNRDIEISDYTELSGTKNSSSNYKVETTLKDLEDAAEMSGNDSRTKAAKKKEDGLMESLQKINVGDESVQATIENTVYSIIKNYATNKLPDYSADAIYELSRSVLDNIAEHAADLADCDSESSEVTKDEVVHIPKQVVCQQVLDRSSECELTHNYDIESAISMVSGPTANIKSCGKGCIQTWLGVVGDNYLPGGSCSLYNYEIVYKVNNPQAITKVELDYAAYDDQLEIYLGPNGSNNLVYRGPLSTFPFETDGTRNGNRCELSTHWIWDPHGIHNSEPAFGCTESSCSFTQTSLPAIDITRYFASLMKGSTVRFFMRVAVGGKGEGYAGLRIYYDPSKLEMSTDDWGPTSCLDTVTAIADGVANGTFTCTDMPYVDSNGCYLQGLTPICEEYLPESPLKNISPLCKKVKVSGNFTFYKGDTGCWQAYMGMDDQGNPLYEEVCGGENVGGNLDTCEEYEEAGCTFLGSECTPGMQGASGNCYVADVTYDCGTDEVISKTTVETDYACTGVRCLGTECAEINETKSTDFAKINALMNMIDQAGQNMDCTGTDEDGNITGTADVTCQIFKGKEGKCKIAVGGWQNCCKENSSTPSMRDYLMTLYSVQKGHATAYALGQTSSAYMSNMLGFNTAEYGLGQTGLLADSAGQYASFIDRTSGAICNTLSKVDTTLFNKAFTTASDSITGMFNEATRWAKDLYQTVNSFIDGLKREITSWIKNQLTKLIPSLGQSAGGAAAGGAAGEVGDIAAQTQADVLIEGIGTALSVVGYVYMAYQIANMIIQLIYACEEDEMETVSKVAVKSCHYVGSYCDHKVLGVCIMKRRSYCCFESPLARIVNEQIRLQKDDVVLSDGSTKQVSKIADWGSAKEPYCEGLQVADLDKVDWDAIDLTEWTNILETNGLSMENEQGLKLEAITGKATSIK